MNLAEIDDYVQSLGDQGRRLAPGEWGVRVSVEGWALDIGLHVRHGLLRAQAMVLSPGQLEADTLLRANRHLDLVTFAQTESGEVWVRGSLAPGAINASETDRLLALVVRAAEWARAQARARARSR
ncbi:MAG TPA: hypothetical protein VGN69_05560 [Solirubrobacteraceae bacterium]|nr:hypothetical protein [Solirubrobacteraceae bacterium]